MASMVEASHCSLCDKEIRAPCEMFHNLHNREGHVMLHDFLKKKASALFTGKLSEGHVLKSRIARRKLQLLPSCQVSIKYVDAFL